MELEITSTNVGVREEAMVAPAAALT
jgi:hypothetical protein